MKYLNRASYRLLICHAAPQHKKNWSARQIRRSERRREEAKKKRGKGECRKLEI